MGLMPDDTFVAGCPFCKSFDIGVVDPEVGPLVCRCCYARGPISQDIEGALYEWNQWLSRPDYQGRVWMHCEEGLSLTKASMARFMVYCLTNAIEIGSVYPFAPQYPRSQVSVSVRLKPEQFEEFEKETGGKLRNPPRITLN